MNPVVERCPNCGVEHDRGHTGPCEVCGSELRYWCRRHSRATGWLNGPECPRCAREAPPAPPPPVKRRPAAGSTVHPPRHRDARAVLREGAGEILPHVAAGASLAMRVARAVFVLMRTVFLWALLGAAAGAAYASFVGGEVMWLALFGLANGAALGLFLGLIFAVRALLAGRSPPRV